jgi:hypothetical protein
VVELEIVERRAVDAGEEPGRLEAAADDAGEPVRAGKGAARPVQHHVLVGSRKEAIDCSAR